MAQHQKRHQPKSLECPHCHHRYAFKNEFKKHLNRVHKIAYDEIPEDIAAYGQITEEGVKFETPSIGRPRKESESIKEENEATPSISDKQEVDIIPSPIKETDEVEVAKDSNDAKVDDEADDDDDDLDDLLLQQLNADTNKNEDIAPVDVANDEDDSKVEEEAASDDEDDLDDLLLQQLNS